MFKCSGSSQQIHHRPESQLAHGLRWIPRHSNRWCGTNAGVSSRLSKKLFRRLIVADAVAWSGDAGRLPSPCVSPPGDGDSPSTLWRFPAGGWISQVGGVWSPPVRRVSPGGISISPRGLPLARPGKWFPPVRRMDSGRGKIFHYLKLRPSSLDCLRGFL